jgi:hypothetical protein
MTSTADLRGAGPGSLYDVLADVIELGEFTLTLDGAPSDELENTAKRFDELVARTFAKRHPVLGALYDVVFEESDVSAGSRRSTKRARLKKKPKRKGMSRIAKAWTAMLTALTVATTDYSKIPENFKAVVSYVEKQLRTEGKDTRVSGYQLPPPMNLPPSEPRQNRDTPPR